MRKALSLRNPCRYSLAAWQDRLHSVLLDASYGERRSTGSLEIHGQGMMSLYRMDEIVRKAFSGT